MAGAKRSKQGFEVLVPIWQGQQNSGCDLDHDQKRNERNEPVTDFAIVIGCSRAGHVLLPIERTLGNLMGS